MKATGAKPKSVKPNEKMIDDAIEDASPGLK